MHTADPMQGPGAFDELPEVFSADALLKASIDRAKDRLEFQVSKADRALHHDIFWSGAGMNYLETDGRPLLEFRVNRRFSEEFSTMFEFSRADSVGTLRDKLKWIPSFKVTSEPS